MCYIILARKPPARKKIFTFILSRQRHETTDRNCYVFYHVENLQMDVDIFV